jgi:hypothetical protein
VNRHPGRRRPDRGLPINGLAKHIEEPAEGGTADRNLNLPAKVDHACAAAHAVRRSKRNAADAIVPQVLLHLQNCFNGSLFEAQGAKKRWRLHAIEFDIDDSADGLNNPAAIHPILQPQGPLPLH